MLSPDTGAGFDVAVKHLFRHLHEPHVLRKNRLVAHFFESPQDTGLGKVHERAALERIHALVRAGAAQCRDADIAAGKEERGLRQHAIVTQQCLEQRPIREVAAGLGISFYHCYRQRAEVCRRVARYICERDDTPAIDPLPSLDEFACLLDRATQRATCVEEGAAYDVTDAVVRAAASAQQKIEALRLGASIAMRFGDFARAEKAYDSAQALLAERFSSEESPSRNVAHACVELIGAKLSFFHANPSAALELAQCAEARLRPARAEGAPRVRQLYIESLYELGAARWNLGNFEQGYEYVADAEARLSRLSSASPRLRVRIMVEVWQMRNYLLMSAKTWYPSWQRRKGLTTAYEEAYASGAFFEAASALVALTEHHAFAGNGDETLRTARMAVTLARQEPSAVLRAQTSIQLAMMLLWTRHWESARSFLPAQPLEACDVYHRELASYFAAERAFRQRAFQDAWNLTRDDAGKEYVGLSMRKKLIAAASAHELERRQDAGVLIEATVPAAKRLGSAPILRDTYRVAAKVTGDSRFKRQANELARLLTA